MIPIEKSIYRAIEWHLHNVAEMRNIQRLHRDDVFNAGGGVRLAVLWAGADAPIGGTLDGLHGTDGALLPGQFCSPVRYAGGGKTPDPS